MLLKYLVTSENIDSFLLVVYKSKGILVRVQGKG